MPTATIEEDDDGIRLDRWFQRHTKDISFNIVSRWSKSGAVRLNGAKAGPGDRVSVGQTLTWPEELPVPVAARPTEKPRAPLSEAQIEYMRAMVLHMDAHAIVINKPPGLATQGGTGITTSVDAMLDALQFDALSRPRLVHRLDKNSLAAKPAKPIGRSRLTCPRFRPVPSMRRSASRPAPAARRCRLIPKPD
jgi:23S rRNA pseudouridine955/2504/2580 synthase